MDAKKYAIQVEGSVLGTIQDHLQLLEECEVPTTPDVSAAAGGQDGRCSFGGAWLNSVLPPDPPSPSSRLPTPSCRAGRC